MTEKIYRNQRLEALHKTGAALHGVGALDKATMRDLDAFCLTKVEDVSAQEIQALRQREGISQAGHATAPVFMGSEKK